MFFGGVPVIRLPYIFLPFLFLVSTLVASCSGGSDDSTASREHEAPEVSAPLPMLPPEVLRQSLGTVLEMRTTTRGGDLIETTDNWTVESAGTFPFQALEKGDWVDLVTVRIDEEIVFQYLCIAQSYECRRVHRIKKVISPRTEEGGRVAPQ